MAGVLQVWLELYNVRTDILLAIVGDCTDTLVAYVFHYSHNFSLLLLWQYGLWILDVYQAYDMLAQTIDHRFTEHSLELTAVAEYMSLDVWLTEQMGCDQQVTWRV